MSGQDESEYGRNSEMIPENEILREIGSMGAGHAATALSELIQQKISITFPEIFVAYPEEVPKKLGLHDMPVVVIYKNLQGSYDCDILLVFGREEADKIVSAMIKNTFNMEELDEEMKKSAIEEVGNIVIGSFLSAISNFTDMELLPTPPIHTTDVFDAILDVFLAKLRLQNRKAMVFQTCFKKNGEEIYGAVIIFLNEKLRDELISRGKSWLEG